MTASELARPPRRLRSALVVTIIAMSIAMVATSATTLASVQDASRTLERGQADALEHSLRAALNELGHEPTAADLRDILTGGAGGGLSYVAVSDDGGALLAAAGTPLVPGLAPPRGERSLRGGLVAVGAGLRSVFHIIQNRSAAPVDRLPGAAGLEVAFEFLPSEARELRAAAARNLRVVAVAAFMLTALALALFERVLRGEDVTAELERSRQLAILGELSTMVAYEIRNPIASLKASAELLAAERPAGETARGNAERVLDEAVRLERLVGDLLEFARARKVDLLPRHPAGLLAEAAGNLGSARVLLDVARAPSSWPLDGKRIVQALTALLEDARCSGEPVRASAWAEDEELIFEIRHQRPVAHHADEERVAEAVHHPGTVGAGLGLAVARRIAELHHGRITVSDAAGGGTRFRLHLPAPPAAPDRSSAPRA